MIMYMYTRYGNQCLPSFAGVGSLQDDTQMLQTFLEWNADDPVNDYEDQRNEYLESAYGNRNPFIDNPALATIIWGGPLAEDRWDILDTPDISNVEWVLYPNPTKGKTLNISSNAPIEKLVVYNLQGQVVMEIQPQDPNKAAISSLNNGFYLVKLFSPQGTAAKKIIVN